MNRFFKAAAHTGIQIKKGRFNAEAQRRKGAERKRGLLEFYYLRSSETKMLEKKQKKTLFSLCASAPLRLCVKTSLFCLKSGLDLSASLLNISAFHLGVA